MLGDPGQRVGADESFPGGRRDERAFARAEAKYARERGEEWPGERARAACQAKRTERETSQHTPTGAMPREE